MLFPSVLALVASASAVSAISSQTFAWKNVRIGGKMKLYINPVADS